MKNRKNRKIFDVLGRRNIVLMLIILIVALVFTSARSAIKAMQDNQVQSIVYKESAKVDYTVYLKENDFFDKNYLGKDKQYIASLINFIGANFKYNLSASETDLKHEYKYKIVAETEVKEEANNNTIYKFSEDLLKEKILEFNTTDGLSIDEKVVIDYNKYNNVIRRFIDTYKLEEIDSTVTVKMYVTVDGVTKSNTPVSCLEIPLTTRTMAIDINSNSVNATELSVYKEIANNNQLYIAILTAILAVMIGIELFIFVSDTKDELAIYKMKVKKILMNYDSYIQRITNDFDFKKCQQLELKTFEDLLQVRDTIAQPILMLENEEENETNFFIPSKENMVYIYKLRLKDIKKGKGDK